MRTPRYYGYQQLPDGPVVITHRCRPVHVVRDRQQVSALLSALKREDAQTVLARCAGRAPAPHPAAAGDRALPAGGTR